VLWRFDCVALEKKQTGAFYSGSDVALGKNKLVHFIW
jgi:hypothetical protein